jgi:16S rRNA G527 N7-methylase RsmG
MSGALLPAEEAHRALLERWRVAMDLVGPGPVAPHFDDAIEAVAGLDARGDWVDLGSGAGFPGIALAARHPGARVLLVESRRKRATFLEAVAAAAALPQLAVRCARVEELPDAAFDGVVSRAYKPPAAYLLDAARLLRPGGRAVLLLARPEPPPPGWRVLDERLGTVHGAPRCRLVLERDDPR